MDKIQDQRYTNLELARLLLAEIPPEGMDESVSEDRLGRMTEMLLRDALRERATDIHLGPETGGVRVRFRIDGAMLNSVLLSDDDGRRLMNQIRTMGGLDPVTSYVPQDARWRYKLDDDTIDLRLSTVPSIGGYTLAIRILDPKRVQQRIDTLGMDEADISCIEDWLVSMAGMFLVTGPTGSGKTTTLYALVHELKQHNRNIVTIEDPVEYQIDGVTQIQVNLRHNLTFAEGLRSMLRLDPDYLLLGEARDAASSKVMVDAAASGRVLMATLHSRDAVGTVTALRNWEIADHEIAATLEMVLAQRLVRKLCPHCRRPETPTALEQRWFRSHGMDTPDEVWHAVGCEACNYVGYHDRTGIYELWQLEGHDLDLLNSHATAKDIRQDLANRGHKFLMNIALEKAATGVTSIDEVRTVSGLGPRPDDEKTPGARQTVTTIDRV